VTASPRTVHFQRSFSEVSACDGHLGGPNTRVPEEVTCSECWEIVKDQARRRHELSAIETMPWTGEQPTKSGHEKSILRQTDVPPEVEAHFKHVPFKQMSRPLHLLMPNALAACGEKPGVAGATTNLSEVTCGNCLMANQKALAEKVDRVHLMEPDLRRSLCGLNSLTKLMPGDGTLELAKATCQKCIDRAREGWIYQVRTVHIADSDDAPVCGLTDVCDVTLDPEAATCIECKRVHELTAKKIVHAWNGVRRSPGLPFPDYGACNEAGKVTMNFPEITCKKCLKLIEEKIGSKTGIHIMEPDLKKSLCGLKKFTKLEMERGTIYPENATCVVCKRVHEEKSK
jgi:hypothetical protein